MDLTELIRKGLPASAVVALAEKLDLKNAMISERLGIPQRTLTRRVDIEVVLPGKGSPVGHAVLLKGEDLYRFRDCFSAQVEVRVAAKVLSKGLVEGGQSDRRTVFVVIELDIGPEELGHLFDIAAVVRIPEQRVWCSIVSARVSVSFCALCANSGRAKTNDNARLNLTHDCILIQSTQIRREIRTQSGVGSARCR